MIRDRVTFTSLRQPIMRILAAVGWIGLVLVFTLTPGDSMLVEEASLAIGGKDYTDANGHIVLFGMLAVLCFWALNLRFAPRKALTISVSLGLLIGTGTELAQTFIPHRGAAWLDMGANWVGVLGAALLVTMGSLWVGKLLRKD
jgi:hypothetical protein